MTITSRGVGDCHPARPRPQGPTGPKYVAGGVHVGMGSMAARQALEHRLAPPVRSVGVPAHGTALRGECWAHGEHVTTSIFRFVRDHARQLTPPGVVDRSVETRLGRGTIGLEPTVLGSPCSWTTHHRGERKVLEHDEVIVIYERARQLVGEVAATVADSTVLLGHSLDGPAATIRSLLLPLQVSLGLREPRRRLPPEQAPVDHHSVGGREKIDDTEVEPHLTSGRRQGGQLNIHAADRDKPTPPLTLDGDRLWGSLDHSVQVDPDVTDALEVQPLGSRHHLPATRVLPLERIEPDAWLEPGESRSLPARHRR